MTVQNGGILSPGHSSGILNLTGNLLLAPGSEYRVELDGTLPGTGYDQTSVFGILTLESAILEIDLGFSPVAGETFTIFQNNGADGVQGAFAGLPEGTLFAASDHDFSISYLGGSGNDVIRHRDSRTGKA